MASQPAAHRAGLRVACRVAERASSLADLQAARLAGHFDKRVAERLAEAWACQWAHSLESEPAARQVGWSDPQVVLNPSDFAGRGDCRPEQNSGWDPEQNPEQACRLGSSGRWAFWTGAWLREAEQLRPGPASA